MADKKRFGILLIVEFLCLLLLLPGCFRQEKSVLSLSGEALAERAERVEDSGEYLYRGLELFPGVYELHVRPQLGDEQRMYVELKADGTFYNSLRSNGINIFPHQNQVHYNVYVLSHISDAYLQCVFQNAGPEQLIQLDMVRTNKGCYMLLFLLLAFFGVIDFLIWFRRQCLAGKIAQKRQTVFWILSAGVVLAFFPFWTDYLLTGADWNFHLTRIAGLADTIRNGTSFPIRVQSYWLSDHGYAVSMFYGDFFLFFPAFLLLIGFPLLSAYKIFLFVVLGVTAIVAYHSFKKCVRDEYAALFGSILYLLMPYHLMNVYNRSALGECLSMAFLPLVCCGMYLLYTEPVTSAGYNRHKWYIVLGMSAILQSHMISVEMTAVFMALVCVLCWKRTFRKQTFLQLLEATCIVLLLNMWYWLPLVYMMGHDVYHLQTITHQTVQDRGLYLAALLQLLPNMGGAQEGVMNCEPVQIGAGALMLFAVAILWKLFILRSQSKADRGQKHGTETLLLCFGLVTLLMSTRYLPWDQIMLLPVVGYIVSSLQFPSRWMVLSSVFASMFAAFFFARVKKEGGKLLKLAMGLAAFLAVFSAIFYVNDVSAQKSPVWLYSVENMGSNSVGNGEYLLEEAGAFGLDISYHDPVAEEGLTYRDYEKKGTRVTLVLKNSSNHTLHVEIPLLGYKGYCLNAEDGEMTGSLPYITDERGSHGDLKIAVPAGYSGQVTVSYQGFPLFHVAEGISLMSLIGLLIWGAVQIFAQIFVERLRKKT